MNKYDLIVHNAEDLKNIETIFDELQEFIRQSNDAEILQKISDITSFLHKSFSDLDTISKNQNVQREEIYIDQSFKPMSLNVKKALEVVKRFEMVWPDKQGNDAAFMRPPSGRLKDPVRRNSGQGFSNDLTKAETIDQSNPVLRSIAPKRLDNLADDYLTQQFEGDPDVTKKQFLRRGQGKTAST